MNKNRTITSASRRGFSLLEVVMAATLSSVALVGALTMLRDGMAASKTIDDRLLMTNYAVSTIEQQLAATAANWTSGTVSGDFSADGHSNIRFIATRSDAVADGGLVDQLMHIQVTTFIDADSDNVLDADEKQCTFRTKVGKFASYEALATS